MKLKIDASNDFGKIFATFQIQILQKMNHSWSLDFLNVSVDLSGKAQEKRKTIISIFSESRLSRSNNELGDHLYNCYTSREPNAYGVSTKFRLELIHNRADC